MRLVTLRTIGRGSILLLLVGLTGIWGCGSSAGKVSGKVYYKNTPLKGGTVTFIAPGRQSLLAEIKEDGSYVVEKLPVGEAIICVDTASLRPPRGMPNLARFKAPASVQSDYKLPDFAERARRYVAIPARFADASKSGLKYRVKGGGQEYDIKLE